MNSLPLSRLLLILVISTGLLSCKERRKSRETAEVLPVVETPAKPADLTKLHPLWTQLGSNTVQFNEMFAKMRVRGHYDGQTQSFNAEMRWQKGKQIWMSFSLLGIEGMRVIITPDSLKVIDRLNKRYFLKPFTFINQKTFMNISYNEFENLLLGQMVLADPLVSDVTEASGKFTVQADTNGMTNRATFSRSPLNLTEQRVEYPALMRNLLATFGTFKPVGNANFAYKRYLRATNGPKEFWAEVDFSEVDINKKLSYPFEINTRYTKVE